MRLFVLLLALALVGGLFVPAAAVTRADGDGIEVVAMSAQSQFPDGIKFSVTARSSEDIGEVRVFLKKTGQTGRSTYRSVEFAPGRVVTGESLLRSGSGGEYFPPGTTIDYAFEIRDKGGAVFRTQDQHFVYSDSRFDWLSLSSGLITVYYYGAYVEERARTVLEAAEAAMTRMAPVLGIQPTEPLRIVSYNNYRHMSAALPFRSQAVREQLQTQGMAFSDERVLLVHGFDATVKGTVSHEFTHLLVAEAAGRAGSLVPAWLNEGLAEYGNIDPTDDYDAALRYGIFTRRLKPLWYLETFGGTPNDIIIAYGQARSVVQLLIGRYGPEKMTGLMLALQQTRDIDQALQQTYGFDQHGLDTEWRIAIGLDPLPPPAQLERQLQTQQPPTPPPAPIFIPTPAPADTPAPESSHAGSAPDAAGGKSSPGCGAPSQGQSGRAAVGLGTLLLLAAPLGLLSFRAFRRRRPG
ncbi:MAG: peptidase MA family metallohydrolase [Chloroflexota bacterium]